MPERTLSVWNKLNLGAGWGAGLALIYQPDSFTSFNNTVKLPAFAGADGALYYTYACGKTRLALNLENLFDKRYLPHG